MVMETVDETKPLSSSLYIGWPHIQRAYDSKYLRKGLQSSQVPQVEIYNLTYPEKVAALGKTVQALMPARSDSKKIFPLKDKLPLSAVKSNWGAPLGRDSAYARTDEKTIKTAAGSTLSTAADTDETDSLPLF